MTFIKRDESGFTVDARSDFECEVCGCKGKRSPMRHVPDGWFYGEMADEVGEVYVIGVCSVACREAFFRPGPGLMTTEGKEPR